jgi:hypothetical protein
VLLYYRAGSIAVEKANDAGEVARNKPEAQAKGVVRPLAMSCAGRLSLSRHSGKGSVTERGEPPATPFLSSRPCVPVDSGVIIVLPQALLGFAFSSGLIGLNGSGRGCSTPLLFAPR